MARSPRAQRYDLSAQDTTTTPDMREIPGRHVYVAAVSPAAAGVARLFIDGTDHGPIRRGLKWVACEGAEFQRVGIASPILAGEVELIVSGADSVPFDSGDADSGAQDARRVAEGFWIPHQPAQVAGPFPLTDVRGDPFWSSLVNGGAGAVPVLTARNLRCGLARPNAGGASGALMAISWPWARLRAEGGALGGELLSSVHPRVLSYNVEMLLRCEAQGNSHAVHGTGLMFMQGNGAGAPSLSGGIAGFGVVRDAVAGAGAWWNTVIRNADAAPAQVDPLPPPVGADVAKWCHFRIEVVDADPAAGRDGLVNVYQDYQLVGAYTNMALFPPSNNGATRTGLDVYVLNNSQAVDALTWARVHYWIDSLVGGGS